MTLNLKPVEFDALGKKTQAALKWEGRILLPKYDGCFAMVLFEYGQGAMILSREGKVVKSMDHIYEDLLVMYPWLEGTQRTAVLGEAWNPGKEFSDLSGEFRRQYPQPQLGFAPFDLVNWNHRAPGSPQLFSPEPYYQRVGHLFDARRVLSTLVFRPQPFTCEGREHAERYAKALKDMGGYDGAICSDPLAAYTPGAGKGGEFIKVKPLVSYSLQVVGWEEATGQKTGRATGALIVRCNDKGETCKVATGLSEEQQADLKQFEGAIIEVEAMGRTSKGLLREPRFKGVRWDVTKADF